MVGGHCHFGWGPAGALDLIRREGCSLVAIVDVLSFSTTVSVATTRGISIVPAAPDRARQIASERGIPLAGEVRAGTPESPWSLAPSLMMSAPIVPEVVLERLGDSCSGDGLAHADPGRRCLLAQPDSCR